MAASSKSTKVIKINDPDRIIKEITIEILKDKELATNLEELGSIYIYYDAKGWIEKNYNLKHYQYIIKKLEDSGFKPPKRFRLKINDPDKRISLIKLDSDQFLSDILPAISDISEDGSISVYDSLLSNIKRNEQVEYSQYMIDQMEKSGFNLSLAEHVKWIANIEGS
jgi:hypothetical protein